VKLAANIHPKDFVVVNIASIKYQFARNVILKLNQTTPRFLKDFRIEQKVNHMKIEKVNEDRSMIEFEFGIFGFKGNFFLLKEVFNEFPIDWKARLQSKCKFNDISQVIAGHISSELISLYIDELRKKGKE